MSIIPHKSGMGALIMGDYPPTNYAHVKSFATWRSRSVRGRVIIGSLPWGTLLITAPFMAIPAPPHRGSVRTQKVLFVVDRAP